MANEMSRFVYRPFLKPLICMQNFLFGLGDNGRHQCAKGIILPQITYCGHHRPITSKVTAGKLLLYLIREDSSTINRRYFNGTLQAEPTIPTSPSSFLFFFCQSFREECRFCQVLALCLKYRFQHQGLTEKGNK